MTRTDPYATRSTDDCGEILCTAPDELPTVPPAWPENGDLSSLPVLNLSAAMVDITRTAATTLPPDLPETV